MRKLASIRKISKISVIYDKKNNPANSIELIQVDGWECVAKKGLYQVGDLVVYFEIDSTLPESLLKSLNLWDAEKNKGMLSKSKGNVLSTKKMLGVLSQGLLAPVSILNNTIPLTEGMDLTDALEITKYESQSEEPLVVYKKGSIFYRIISIIQKFVTGLIHKDYKRLNKLKFLRKFLNHTKPFPSFIKKTSQERVQNIGGKESYFLNEKLFVTEKLEGTSSTYYFINGKFGLCSNNVELGILDNSHYGKIQEKYSLFEKLVALNKNIALQGEIIGPGIAKNYYDLKELKWYCFNIFLIDENRKASPEERLHILSTLRLFKTQVPVITKELIITENLQEQSLALANRMSQINPNKIAEGVIFQKHVLSNHTFKAINNNYLLKQES